MMENEKKPEEESDLQSAWRVFDLDNKGYIESKELRQIISSMDDKIPKDEIQQLINDADLAKDRRITFDGQFLSHLMHHRPPFAQLDSFH